MSRERAEKILNLEFADRVGLQYCVEHPGFLRDFTGIDPTVDLAGATVSAMKKMDVDLVGGIPQKMEEPFEEGQSARLDDQGIMTTQWGYGSTPWYEGDLADFSDEQEVLNYNPLEKSFLPWQADYSLELSRIERFVGDDAFPMCCVSYFSLVTHCTAVFGWENFLMCSASKPDDFEHVLENVGTHTLSTIDKMINVGSGVCAIHDDIAMTKGLIVSPQWLRRYVLPWYERFFDKIRKAGQKALFISDGNYAKMVDDLLAVGADGFYIEHSFDLESMMRKCYEKAFLLATFDQRVLAGGSENDVRDQTRKYLSLAKKRPGNFISLTVPHDVQLKNIYAFLKTFNAESAI